MKKRYGISIICVLLLLALLGAAAADGTDKTFWPIRNASVLIDGLEVVLLSDDGASYYASGTAQTSVRNAVAVTLGDDDSFVGTSGVGTFVLRAVEGGWALYDAAGGVYLAASDESDYQLIGEAELSANSTWTITVGSNAASIVSKGDAVNNTLRFDPASHAFVCAPANAGLSPVVLYSNPETRSFTVTWKNYDGTVLAQDTVRGGQIPVYTGEEPKKPSDETYYYYFQNWSPEPAVTTEDAVYTAQFESITRACGNSLYWEFDEDTGVLTITGSGDMTYWNFKRKVPWDRFRAQIRTVILPDQLTKIGSYAFTDCTELQSVTMPCSAGVVSSAFDGCTSITTVHLTKGTGVMVNYDYENYSPQYTPWYICRENAITVTMENGIQNIGVNAFYECTGLRSITIPNSVTSIGECAFYNCTGLQSINIPDSVTYISGETFYGCTGLTRATLGNGVKTIYGEAFYGCTGLSEITIPDSVTSIDYHAFRACTGLTRVTLGNGVTSIGSSAFYGCTGLSEISIPDSVNNIGDSAFSGCTALSEITIGDGIAGIGRSSFMNTAWWDAQSSGLVYLDYVLLGYKDTCSQIITIKSGTRTLADHAFSGCSEIKRGTLPDSLEFIGGYAFSGCTGLSEITIPDGVTSIGGYAFSGCTGLSEITIPDSVTSIGNSVFSGCTGLSEITIGNSVASIGYSAFSSCTGLSEITIPDSVTSIGGYAFSGCTRVKSFSLGNSLASIGEYAFSGCRGLTDIYYHGTKTQKDEISVRYGNEPLLDATWHHIPFGVGPTGWQKLDGLWYYLDQNSETVFDWQQIGGVWYFFADSGVMQTDWQQIDGKWYYFAYGVMQTDWRQIGGKWYYFNASGVMQTGWQQIGGKWFYFNGNGVMQTGWQQLGGKWYYFNGNGVMQTGWQQIGGKWYYFESSGAMVTGTKVINGKTYRFNSSGVCLNP